MCFWSLRLRNTKQIRRKPQKETNQTKKNNTNHTTKQWVKRHRKYLQKLINFNVWNLHRAVHSQKLTTRHPNPKVTLMRASENSQTSCLSSMIVISWSPQGKSEFKLWVLWNALSSSSRDKIPKFSGLVSKNRCVTRNTQTGKFIATA